MCFSGGGGITQSAVMSRFARRRPLLLFVTFVVARFEAILGNCMCRISIARTKLVAYTETGSPN